MRITIDASPHGPLAVLDQLPDARLAIVEGLNGIGKTLAVRLLELCTGTMPYSLDSPAWTSLTKGLGPFAVQVTGLANGRVIRWEGLSDDWRRPDGADDDVDEGTDAEADVAPGSTPSPLAASPSPTTEWFRRVEIDGQSATLDDVRRLFIVHRIAGDEGLVETLANHADGIADTIRRWARRHAAEEHSALARLEARVDEALRHLGEVDAERFLDVNEQLTRKQDELAAIAAESEEVQVRADRFASARRLRDQLDELRARSPDLAERLVIVDSEIHEAQLTREALHGQLAQAATRLGGAEGFQHELRNARRTLERNRKNLSKALEKASAEAASLGVGPSDDEVGSHVEALESNIGRLEAEQLELDAAPAMRGLLDDLVIELTDAEIKGLERQVALEDPESDLRLTVAQTKSGMVVRRVTLEGQPPPAEARAVVQQLSQARSELAAAMLLAASLAKVARFRRLIEANEGRVETALVNAQPQAADDFRQLDETRRQNDNRLLSLASERAALIQQLGSAGGQSEAQLATELATVVRELGTTQAELEAATVAAEEQGAVAQALRISAEDDVNGLHRDVAVMTAEIRRARSALAENGSLDWLRHALGADETLPDSEPFEALKRIDAARQALESVLDRMGRHRAQLAGVETALRAAARHLRHEDRNAIEYVPEIGAWLSKRFSAWLNSSRIRIELLPEAVGDIVVDVDTRDVQWTESADRPRSRPLEAFSSGEQAFAYTRARLADLDEDISRAENRLIALDEFGAFIAHDRLAGLLGFLKDRTSENPTDQVVVILPLGRDYASEAESSTRPEADRLADLANQIERHRYAVQVVVQ